SQQLSVRKEEVPPEQQERSPSPDQEDPPEPPHIKEEQEDLWSIQEGDQLQGLEEEDIIKFTFTPVPERHVGDYGETPPFSQRHGNQTEGNRDTEGLKAEAGGGSEPDRNFNPGSDLLPHEETSHSFGSKIYYHFEGGSEAQSGFNALQNSEAGGKPFSCRVCGKRYHQKRSLANHMRLHSEGKYFSCSICKKTFPWRRDVVTHMRIHTGEKPFSCSFCGARFAQSSHLTLHLRVHTGEKPFTCSVCNASFSVRKSLVDHMTIHTGEKPHNCSICGKRFAQNGALRRHLAVHTGEKPFNCSVCEKRFTRLEHVKNHKCAGESSADKFWKKYYLNMSKIQDLRGLVNQRLTAAAEEIFELFERTIAEYEEQLRGSKEEQLKLLDSVYNQEVFFHRAAVFPADVQQLLESKEVPSEQQERSSSPDQEDPQDSPHNKAEQEELRISQEGDHLQGLEEAETTMVIFTPVLVKSEDDDEEEPQSSQLSQVQTEEMETGADGKDCGGPGPGRSWNPESEVRTEDSFGLDFVKQVNNERPEREKKPHRCFECGKSYKKKGLLAKHRRTHTGEKPFSCSLCGKKFTQRPYLKRHEKTHTGEKLFCCSQCGKKFTQRTYLKRHQRVHTGEKPFSCSVCGRGFPHMEALRRHAAGHVEKSFVQGEKPSQQTHDRSHQRETDELI
ncbi:zinc finger protein 316-like, partial [Notolabrus celidotus]|uniref:zinc finger protein 316-like n=1 Tax=Notolabrus celidotus TaxID=1203425 RepID=UPI0014908A4E